MMLEVRRLQKSFGSKIVLDNLSFNISKGEIYGLLGPNGAGKTTAINILCHLLAADDGEVKIANVAVDESVKYRMGVVPQEIAVYRDLTCRENLRFFGKLYGLHKPKIAEREQILIELFKLQSYQDSVVNQLSGGWQRRVNIAVSLMHSPLLLVLDEPTAGLDIAARLELWKLIKSLQNEGVTILLTTHQLEEAERLCSRIGILQRGKLIAEGTPQELCAMVPAQQLAVIETENIKAACEKARALGWQQRDYGGKLTFLLQKNYTLKDLVEKLEGVPLTSVTLQSVRLEHAYIEATHQ